MDTLWTYNGQGGVQGPGVYDDAEASYSDSQYKITITNYLYSKDGILGNQDWVSPYSTDPNGRTDCVGRVSFNVETVPHPVPEPSTMLLLGSGLVGLAGFRRKINNRRQ